jgi:hypothetical protein
MRERVVGIDFELNGFAQLCCFCFPRFDAANGLDRRGIGSRFDAGIGLSNAQHDHGAETDARDRQAIKKAAPRHLGFVSFFLISSFVLGIIVHCCRSLCPWNGSRNSLAKGK